MRQLDLSRNFSEINQKGGHFGIKGYGGMSSVQLASKQLSFFLIAEQKSCTLLLPVC
jgi:hypothetical protein